MSVLADRAPFAGRLVEEAGALIEASELRRINVRLMGGVGIRLLLGAQLPSGFERPYRDIDVITMRQDSRELEKLLAERGWEPSAAFNALNGSRRLLFTDPWSDAQVDVFVSVFEMCHKLPLADCLEQSGPSLPATDLLMTKLQIVELNEKDRNDCYALLCGCPAGRGAPTSIDPGRIADLTSRDWGLHHTFELNLRRLVDGVGHDGPGSQHKEVITTRINVIEDAMDNAPKSRAWGIRARIGERKRWYEQPEEVDRSPT
jgi:hypothetical protein